MILINEIRDMSASFFCLGTGNLGVRGSGIQRVVEGYQKHKSKVLLGGSYSLLAAQSARAILMANPSKATVL